MAKSTKAKKKQQKGISMLLVISISFIFIGLLTFKIINLTGNVVTPPCSGGSTLIKFYVYCSKSEDSNDGPLSKARITLQPPNKNCMYSDKTNKNGYSEFSNIVPGTYKLIVEQKDIGKGKSLCDKYRTQIEILRDSEYTILLTNCNDHAFNIQ